MAACGCSVGVDCGVPLDAHHCGRLQPCRGLPLMAGYQTIEALRPILHRGPVPTPVVSRELVRPPKPPTDLQVRQAKMCELRAGGMSTYAIAAMFKTSRASVQRATRNMAPPDGGWPNGGKVSRFSRTKAARMHRAGFTFKEIGEDFGCSESNAHKLVTGYNTRSGSRCRPTRRFEDMVSRATGVVRSDLRIRGTANSRTSDLVKARDILFWLSRQRCSDLSLRDLSKYLGGFDKSTILHGANRCGAIASRDGIVLTDDARSGGLACRALWAAQW